MKMILETTVTYLAFYIQELPSLLVAERSGSEREKRQGKKQRESFTMMSIASTTPTVRMAAAAVKPTAALNISRCRDG